MAQEVWNMLKAVIINAKIQIGGYTDRAKEITDSDHAWILRGNCAGFLTWPSKLRPGMPVTQKENPLYYLGWSFQSPKDYKDYANLLNEYNLRVAVSK